MITKSRILLGGPAHGTFAEIPVGKSYHMVEKVEGLPNTLANATDYCKNMVVRRIIYLPQRFTWDYRTYLVFIVEGLEENVALDLFKVYEGRIPVDDYIRQTQYQLSPTGQDYYRRVDFMNELLPTGPSGKPGKALKTFVLAYCYGAGNKTLQEKTGLSLRRIKVLKRRIDNFGGLLNNAKCNG